MRMLHTSKVWLAEFPGHLALNLNPPCSVHFLSTLYSNVHTHCWTFPPPMLNITPFFFLLGHFLAYPTTAFVLGTVFVLEKHHSKLYRAQLYWDDGWQQHNVGRHWGCCEGIKWLCTGNWQRHGFKYFCKCLGSHMAFIFPIQLISFYLNPLRSSLLKPTAFPPFL